MNARIAAIREQYPDPISFDDYYEQGSGPDAKMYYCVGGALCLALGGNIHFPDDEELGVILREMNPALDEETAEDFASEITEASDNEDFELAWEIASRALDFTS